MNHLNSSPNQSKTKTQSQSERQNRSERRERGRCSQPHTTRRRRRSVAHNPQPVCYHGPWPLHHRATTIRPPSNPAKTHNPHATTATTKPPTQRRHHRERLAERALIWWERFEFLEREVWVFWERVDEKVNNDPWPTATVAFKALIIPVNFVTSLIFLTFCSSFFIFSIFNQQIISMVFLTDEGA